jgi:hypothetical protein
MVMRDIGFLVTAVLALGVVDGCATTGGEGIVGETTAAITSSDVTTSANLTISGTDKFHQYGSWCVLTDPTGGAGGTAKSYLLAAAGLTTAGAFSHDAHLFDGTSWVQTNYTDNTLLDYKFAATMLDPQNQDTCVAFGGENGSGKRDTIVSFKVGHSGSTVTLTIAQAGKLSAARSKLSVVDCDGNILAIGGDTGSASGVLDVWSPSFMGGTSVIPTLKNTNMTPATVTLNTARFDLAAVSIASVSGSKDGIVMAGGSDGTNTKSQIEIIRTNASCAMDDSSATKATDLSGLVSSAKLGTTGTADPRSELAGFYDATNSRFVFAAGYNGTAASRNEDRITVNWTTFSSSSGTSVSNAVPVATASPLVVLFTTSRHFLFGGANSKRATGTPIAEFQEYNAATWTHTSTDTNLNSLPARLGAFGGKLGSSLYVGGGNDGTNYLKTMHKVF